MLFAATTMVGVLSVVGMQTVMGPVTTITKVTQKNLAENDLLMNAKVVVMNAATRPKSGDEDEDGYIEPVPFVPTTDPSCTLTLPGNGGCLPADIGAILTDPWGTQYAYCVWDHGDPASSTNRINGEDSTSGAVVAILSAGPDKTFQTPCSAYDGDPDSADTAIEPDGLGDDIVQIYTYAGAAAGSGGLWKIKSDDAETAIIDKKLEVGDVAGGKGFAFDTVTGQGEFPYIKTDFIASKTGGDHPVEMTSGLLPADEATISTCGASQEGVMRVNKATPGVPQLEICNGNGLWVPASGGSTVPIGAVMAFDATSCPNGWTAISALSGRMIIGSGGGYALGDEGGAATITLTEAQIPGHSHVVDPPNTGTNVAGNHGHIVDPPNTSTTTGGWHNHPIPARDAYDTTVLYINDQSGDSIVSSDNMPDSNSIARNNRYYTDGGGNHAHTVDIGPFWSAAAGDHSHVVDIAAFWSQATGGGQAHENRPPYKAYLYCRYQGGTGGVTTKDFNDLDDVDTSGVQDNDILVWDQSAGQWLTEQHWTKNGSDLVYKGGDIGIGVDGPTARLHVKGDNTNQTTAIITAIDGLSVLTANLPTLGGPMTWPTSWGGGLATWDFMAASGMIGSALFIGVNDLPEHSQSLVVDNGSTGGADQTVAKFGNGAGSLFLTHNAPHVSGNLRYDDGNWRYEGTGAGTTIGLGWASNGDVIFNSAPAGNAGQVASLKETMRIKESGNVGIGTNAPLSPLEVVFDNRAAGITNDVIIRRPENTADWSPITFIRSRGTLSNPSPVQNGDHLGGLLDHVVLNGTDRNGTSTAGYVTAYTGNGTTNLSTMNLYTSGGKTGVFITDGTTPTRVRIPANDGGSIMEDWPATWGGGLATWDIVGSSTYFGSYVTRSDRRYKENIEPLDHTTTTEQLMKLKPVTYDYKDGFGPEGRQFGFIAQDVREVMPDLVTGEETADKKLGLNYQGLIAPMIAAIQDLKLENDNLRAELKAANDNFEQRLDQLESRLEN